MRIAALLASLALASPATAIPVTVRFHGPPHVSGVLGTFDVTEPSQLFTVCGSSTATVRGLGIGNGSYIGGCGLDDETSFGFRFSSNLETGDLVLLSHGQNTAVFKFIPWPIRRGCIDGLCSALGLWFMNGNGIPDEWYVGTHEPDYDFNQELGSGQIAWTTRVHNGPEPSLAALLAACVAVLARDRRRARGRAIG